jgi:hypothetical protein
MTPEKKAVALVQAFIDEGFLPAAARIAALIAVDEILKICVDSLGLTDLDYWQDVKEEIEAL